MKSSIFNFHIKKRIYLLLRKDIGSDIAGIVIARIIVVHFILKIKRARTEVKQNMKWNNIHL